jgi:predicted anti-sigma-YlaC factor YlaD
MSDTHHRSCQEVARELSDELDGECTWWRRLHIRLHLWLCPPCKRGRDALARTVDLLGSLPDQPCIDIDGEEPDP